MMLRRRFRGLVRDVRIGVIRDERLAPRTRGADLGVLVVAKQRLLNRVRRRWRLLVLDRSRQLGVLAHAAVAVAEDAARVIDEAQRLLDVPLPVARLCIIFANQATQRRAHFLV